MSESEPIDAAGAVPDNRGGELFWETGGVIAGFSGCLCIALQIRGEWASPAASSLSIGYLAGFLVIFSFWTAYGLRFRRPALWLTNGLAVGLQALLLALVLGK